MREPDSQDLTRVLLGGLVFVMGVQSMRFLFASTAWYLRDTLGIATLDLIPIALAPFLLAVSLPILSRWAGIRGSLMISVWLLALSRLGLQLFDAPQVDFWMSAAGTLAFVAALPLLLSVGRETIVGGVLVGLALDSGIKGLFSSLDLAYQPGWLAVLVAGVMGGAAVVLALTLDYMPRRGAHWGSGALLLGLGPFLWVQYLILQNQGWTAEMTGLSAPLVALRIALLNVVTILVVARWHRSRVLGTISALLLATTVVIAEGDTTAFNIMSLIAVPAAGMVWAVLVPATDQEGVAASTTYLTTGATLFVVLGFAYYLPLDLNIGFDSADVRVAVGLAIGVLGLLGALRVMPERSGVGRLSWVFAAGAAALPLFALIVVMITDSGSDDGGDLPLRVMSYNLHSAFNTEGTLDAEAIARVIEDSGATVIGLQEVPRGRLLSGNTDLYYLLAEELGFEHVEFFGTTDPTWGNAIFSRFPITAVERVYLPKEGTPMQRGYLAASLSVDGGTLLFASTHLQHLNDPDVHDDDPEADLYPVHHAQIETLLDVWNDSEPAILVGDFNARPDWRQIQELIDAGWVDGWAVAGLGDGFTTSSDDPEHRIDYVFVTPDLEVLDAGVLQSTASDHLPVVADLSR